MSALEHNDLITLSIDGELKGEGEDKGVKSVESSQSATGASKHGAKRGKVWRHTEDTAARRRMVYNGVSGLFRCIRSL